MREVELAFSDVREYKLLDSVYTKEDVRGIVNELHEEVRGTVEKELENATHVAAAMVKLLLSQAEDGGCAPPLSIDTNKLEDMKLLQDIKAIEKVALSRPATDFAPTGAAMMMKRQTLSKMSEVGASGLCLCLCTARFFFLSLYALTRIVLCLTANDD